MEEFRERYWGHKVFRRRKRYHQDLQVDRTSIVQVESIWSISVVVPVAEGNADLKNLLMSVQQQRRCQLEVILINSSGGDLGEFIPDGITVKTISIARVDFSHSASRNLGVSQAVGDYVFLTVQDAQFPHSEFLATLAALVAWKGLSCLSVAEQPRPDADQYARFAISSHYKGLFGGPDRMLIDSRLKGGRRQRIAAASIGNVGCLYRRSVFDQHEFSGAFGEDLLLAVRLLESGMAVGKTNVERIIHSHTRPPFYWLRRMYVSRILMASNLMAEPPLIADEPTVVCLIGEYVQGFARLLPDFEPNRTSNQTSLERIAQFDEALAAWLSPWLPHAYPSPQLRALFDDTIFDFEKFSHDSKETPTPADLLKALTAKLGWLLGGCKTAKMSARSRTLMDELERNV